MTHQSTPEKGTQIGGPPRPETSNDEKMSGGVAAPPPASRNDAQQGDVNTRCEDITAGADVTAQTTPDITKIEPVPSVREKILAARKAPDEVAKLLEKQSEQLSVPLYKRPPDASYWRVRTGGEWDPTLSQVLLLPRKDGGGGPEFLLVLPELEPLFQSDTKLKNLAHPYYLAFVVDARRSVGWWAVRSHSENEWHVSARTAMRRLMDDWGMVKADQGAKGYKLEKPADNLGEPVWPVGTYDDWLVKCFSDKLIDSVDHPVLKELQGRK